MIGSLGYSSVECAQIPVSIGRIAVSCPYGTVGKIIDYGVNNPSTGSPPDACITNDHNRSCKPTSARSGEIFKQAIGKKEYMVKFTKGDLYVGDPGKTCNEITNEFFV